MGILQYTIPDKISGSTGFHSKKSGFHAGRSNMSWTILYRAQEIMNKKLSRRDFLKLAGITSAGLALSACGLMATELPKATSVPPTETASPTPTVIPIPSTPTVKLTPTPENIADAKDLSVWVDEFVHAYGGKVVVNGIEMDASQLIDAIDNNAETFTQVKCVKGTKYPLLIVNNIPLALMGVDGKWSEATLKNISGLTDISFGIGGEPTGVQEFGSAYYLYNFTQKDRDLRIKQSILAAPADIFQTGAILHKGEGLYDWSRPDRLIVRYKNEGLQVRAVNIIWANDFHPDWLIELSKKGMQNPQLYKEEFTKTMKEYINAAVTSSTMLD